jgi:cob(I)alamin adenosyltransferase
MGDKIYTKAGDKGSTVLIGGTKVLKSHLRIEAYGTVDELNSYLGLCRDLLTNKNSGLLIKEIQDRLFTIGSSLACDPEKEPKMKLPDLVDEDVKTLESAIDKMNETLPPMRNFIIPGGHPAVSHLHIGRCICRRAERCIVRLLADKEEVESIIITYLNRLSDYLFVLARYTAHELKIDETPWKPRLI